MVDFGVGDVVKFVGVDGSYNHNAIPKWTAFIPDRFLKHGSVVVGPSYYEDFAVIRGVHEDLFCVEFTDVNGNRVCLGFKKDVLKLVSPFKVSNWKSEMKK